MQKRILRELTKSFPESVRNNNEDYIISINETHGQRLNIINNLTIYSKNYDCEICVYLSDSYPFKPPKITFNSLSRTISYSYWCSQILKHKDNYSIFISYIFTCINMKTLEGIKKNIPDNKSCLCCESYICSDSWNPSINLFMIFNECVFRKNLFPKGRPVADALPVPDTNNST